MEQPCSVVLTFSHTGIRGKGNRVSCQLLKSVSLLFLLVNACGFFFFFLLQSLAGDIVISVRPWRPSSDTHLTANVVPSRNRLAQMTTSRQKLKFFIINMYFIQVLLSYLYCFKCRDIIEIFCLFKRSKHLSQDKMTEKDRRRV